MTTNHPSFATSWAVVLLALIGFGFSTLVVAEEPKLLPAFELEDQNKTKHQLDNSVLRIYATADRKTDKLFAKAMTERGQDTLDQQQAIVVADISKAPGFVKRIIRSSLKDRSYTTWLDTRSKTRGLWDNKPNHITILELQNRQVLSTRHISSLEELEEALGQAPSAPEQ